MEIIRWCVNCMQKRNKSSILYEKNLFHKVIVNQLLFGLASFFCSFLHLVLFWSVLVSGSGDLIQKIETRFDNQATEDSNSVDEWIREQTYWWKYYLILQRMQNHCHCHLIDSCCYNSRHSHFATIIENQAWEGKKTSKK